MPFSYKPPYLSPTCSSTRCQKNYLERPLKCRNEEQEARRKKKIEQEKVKGKFLNIRDGGLEDVPLKIVLSRKVANYKNIQK